MSYLFTFIAGFALHFSYSKGWLVTPAIFIVKTVKGWVGTKTEDKPK